MRVVADLHIHSRFSRATSGQINLENLEKFARLKGVNLLGTGDFTHPIWLKELKNNLVEEDGILRTKNNFTFVLQSEISLMYSQGSKGRRIHAIILAPNFEVVEQINETLIKKGRLDYDGRPIFGFSGVELVEMMNEISEDIEIIPAHIWTPWFGLLGSMSGFDSIEEAFEEKAKYIHALETGLSSDPAMNWRLSKLDKYSLVSFSDMHSFWPWRLGREATIFDIELSYKNLIKALRTKVGLAETIEVDPNYGKYHFDGHRHCGISFNPQETIKKNYICPKCSGKLTVGVLHRVEKLADREENFKPINAIPFKTLIPLSELIGASLNIKQLYSKKVSEIQNKLVSEFGNEFEVLLNVDGENLKKVIDERIVRTILKNREGRLKIEPGFDGEYGKLLLDKEDFVVVQKSLSDF